MLFLFFSILSRSNEICKSIFSKITRVQKALEIKPYTNSFISKYFFLFE